MPNKYTQDYYQRNKEQIKRRAVEWGQSEKGKQYFKRHYQENKEYYKNNSREYWTRLKLSLLTHYGGGKCACVICNESRLACLSIDHIHGGGNKHRKISGSGGNMYLWLKRNNFPEGFQTLCMNCQYVKRFLENEC